MLFTNVQFTNVIIASCRLKYVVGSHSDFFRVACK